MNLLQLARKHVGNGAAMESSARLCLADAVRHHDEGNLKQAELHALRSMAYSIGTMGGDYRKAWKHVFGDAPVRLPKAVDFLDALEADESVSV